MPFCDLFFTKYVWMIWLSILGGGNSTYSRPCLLSPELAAIMGTDKVSVYLCVCLSVCVRAACSPVQLCMLSLQFIASPTQFEVNVYRSHHTIGWLVDTKQ